MLAVGTVILGAGGVGLLEYHDQRVRGETLNTVDKMIKGDIGVIKREIGMIKGEIGTIE